MPRSRLRRIVALCLLAFAAAASGSCRDRSTGETRVLVIGPEPQFVDPSRGPLTRGDAVLLAAVAQGLVAFDSAGNIVGALAERWTVSDDGLSYIFRLAPARWSNGGKVTAEQVVRALNRSRASSGRNDLRDTLGAVGEIVAMTDRVLEIRLLAPRPNILALLAQPEFAVIRSGRGTGPFLVDRQPQAEATQLLERSIPGNDDREESKETLSLAGAPAEKAISAFVRGEADLVLGGTVADLPLVQRVKLPRGALQFDPASGLYGLVPLKSSGPFADAEVRSLLSRAIDRDSFAAALGVPGLLPRATLLEAGLDGLAQPQPPAWMALTPDARRSANAAEARRLFGRVDLPPLRLYLPEGAGSDLLLHELELDWGALGLKLERVRSVRTADFALIDEIAPSTSPAWFVRRFRCSATPVCDSAADELLDQARASTIPDQRYALIAQAAAIIDSNTLFVPITAPVRWSLVGERVTSFRTNRFARHTLIGLRQAANGRE